VREPPGFLARDPQAAASHLGREELGERRAFTGTDALSDQREGIFESDECAGDSRCVGKVSPLDLQGDLPRRSPEKKREFVRLERQAAVRGTQC